MNRIERDALALCVDDAGGDGLPVIFQHGLCGDARQTADAFPADPRFRRISLECRGHGDSEAGDTTAFSIETFAADVAALIEASAIAPVVVGGISMGAAIALRLAVLRPELVKGLILVRPAWVTDRAPANMAANAEVGRLLADHAAADARAAFLSGATAARLRAEAPDNLASLTGFFDRSPQVVTAALLSRISEDGPGVSAEQLHALKVPTLVVGHERDAVHPLGTATDVAALIPAASLSTITPKADDRVRYTADLRQAIVSFLEGFL